MQQDPPTRLIGLMEDAMLCGKCSEKQEHSNQKDAGQLCDASKGTDMILQSMAISSIYVSIKLSHRKRENKSLNRKFHGLRKRPIHKQFIMCSGNVRAPSSGIYHETNLCQRDSSPKLVSVLRLFQTCIDAFVLVNTK